MLDRIQNICALYGYDQPKRMTPDAKLDKVVEEICELDTPTFNGVDVPYISKGQMVSDAKKFINSKLLLRDVGYLSNIRLFFLMAFAEAEDMAELASIYNSGAKIVSPFDIPIKYDNRNIFSGTLRTQMVASDDEELLKDLLPRLNVYFSKILLSKHVTPIETSCYVHEIMHTQLFRYKGFVSSYYDSEVLSIFMELLHAYESNKKYFYMIVANRINQVLLSYNNLVRFQQQGGDANYINFGCFSDAKYIVSIMQAFDLFAKYEERTFDSKKCMLIELQSVIEGYRTLDDFLEKHSVSYEESLSSATVEKVLKK